MLRIDPGVEHGHLDAGAGERGGVRPDGVHAPRDAHVRGWLRIRRVGGFDQAQWHRPGTHHARSAQLGRGFVRRQVLDLELRGGVQRFQARFPGPTASGTRTVSEIEEDISFGVHENSPPVAHPAALFASPKAASRPDRSISMRSCRGDIHRRS